MLKRMLKAIHAQEDKRSAESKTREVVKKLKAMRLAKASELVETKASETLTYSLSRVTTGDRSRRTTRWCASFARSADERAWSAHFPTDSPH